MILLQWCQFSKVFLLKISYPHILICLYITCIKFLWHSKKNWVWCQEWKEFKMCNCKFCKLKHFSKLFLFFRRLFANFMQCFVKRQVSFTVVSKWYVFWKRRYNKILLETSNNKMSNVIWISYFVFISVQNKPKQ